MKKERKYKPTETGQIELPEEQHQDIQRIIQQAEEDIEAARVSFRWTKNHVDLVKTVANAIGIPYQTYIKQIIYKQAVQDLKSLTMKEPLLEDEILRDFHNLHLHSAAASIHISRAEASHEGLLSANLKR
jgi:predicted DNA binding CopG/RHH family protein